MFAGIKIIVVNKTSGKGDGKVYKYEWIEYH